MLAPVVVLALFVTLVDQGCGFVDANRHFFDDDHLLRDLSTQDEVLDVNCCGNNPDFNEIPANLLLEVSQLTSAQFMEKFLPKPDRIQVLSEPLDTGESERMAKSTSEEDFSSPVFSEKLKMQLPVDHFVAMEDHQPKISKIIRPEPSFNFRMAKLLEEPPIVIDIPLAENARCQPRETIISMPKPQNISLQIWPLCTTVKQCGGCCANSNLLCKPTQTSTIYRKAMHMGYTNGQLRVVDKNVIIPLTEHTECQCVCRQNASDCSANQSYEPGNCRCVCLNHDLAGNCGPNRVWDPERCECRCPNASGTCPIGFHFDSSHYCSCLSNVINTTNFRQSKTARVKKTLQPVQAPAAAPASVYQMDSPARRSRSDRG